MKGKFIRWLSECSLKDYTVVGKKAANLAELYNSRYPVPNAFCITREAFNSFLEENKLTDQIKQILSKIKVEDYSELRSLSDEIKQLILNGSFSSAMSSEILEAYDNLNVNLQGLESSPGALAILKSSREPIFVSVRGSKMNGDSPCCTNSFLNVKGNPELLDKIRECFASAFNARLIYYQREKGFDELFDFSVIVQKMIDSEKSGVAYSYNPLDNNSSEIFIESVFGLGEGLVSGRIKPDEYYLNKDFEVTNEEVADKKVAMIRTASGQTKMTDLIEEKSKQRVLRTHEIKQIAEAVVKLEKFFNSRVEMDFSIWDGKLYILQVGLVEEKDLIKKREFEGHLLIKGRAVSFGVSSGTLKILNSLDDLGNIKKSDIILPNTLKRDLIIGIDKSSGIITEQGGVSSIFGVYARKKGVAGVSGIQDCVEKLQEGLELNVDGYQGNIFSGKVQDKKDEFLPIVETKTVIKVCFDLPSFAEKATKTKASGVGLLKLDSLISEIGKHPCYYLKNDKLDEYKDFLKEGIEKVCDCFIGKPVWVRLSDIRSDQCLTLEGGIEKNEKNPLLGDHGIRFLLKNKEILKSEILAVKNVCDKGHDVGLILPNVVSVDEIKKAKEILTEVGFNSKLGIMIEAPAPSILIKDICEEGIDFVLFDIDRLAQHTLAADFSNEEVNFDSMNWAVLKLISRVIRECKSKNVETSLFGSTVSRPEMLEFLINQGIGSITVEMDKARETSEIIEKIEKFGSLEGIEKANNKIEQIDDLEKIEEKIEDMQEEDEEDLEKLNEGTSTVIIDKTPKSEIFEGKTLEEIEEEIEERREEMIKEENNEDINLNNEKDEISKEESNHQKEIEEKFELENNQKKEIHDKTVEESEIIGVDNKHDEVNYDVSAENRENETEVFDDIKKEKNNEIDGKKEIEDEEFNAEKELDSNNQDLHKKEDIFD